MPKFNVTITRQLEQSCTMSITAINEYDAYDKAEALIKKYPWDTLTKNVSIDDVDDEVTVDDIQEAMS